MFRKSAVRSRLSKPFLKRYTQHRNTISATVISAFLRFGLHEVPHICLGGCFETPNYQECWRQDSRFSHQLFYHREIFQICLLQGGKTAPAEGPRLPSTTTAVCKTWCLTTSSTSLLAASSSKQLKSLRDPGSSGAQKALKKSAVERLNTIK